MQKPTISYADFAKLDIRIGTITGCERVEGEKISLLIPQNKVSEGTVIE